MQFVLCQEMIYFMKSKGFENIPFVLEKCKQNKVLDTVRKKYSILITKKLLQFVDLSG